MPAPPPGRRGDHRRGRGVSAEVAQAAADRGCDIRIIGLRGFAARAIQRYPTVWADMLDPNRILDELRRIAPDAVVLAGNVTRPGPLAVGSVYSGLQEPRRTGGSLRAGTTAICEAS